MNLSVFVCEFMVTLGSTPIVHAADAECPWCSFVSGEQYAETHNEICGHTLEDHSICQAHCTKRHYQCSRILCHKYFRSNKIIPGGPCTHLNKEKVFYSFI
ncbi:hypothetical protein PGT21_027874 [Puccinia graminis f. sp. tritici]|uniref:Secreted protein n=1 Tax=Puccinia graminis f. sp. tritici TaxID=56615 RepID=A0A5B0NP19_PUCGR|nr:hypothetical protein PGT21_027874 [Puccinia graminis f. sp. tritici]